MLLDLTMAGFMTEHRAAEQRSTDITKLIVLLIAIVRMVPNTHDRPWHEVVSVRSSKLSQFYNVLQ